MVHPPTFRASLRQCLNMNILKTIKDKSFEIFWQIGDGLPENILQNFMIWDGVIQVLKIKKIHTYLTKLFGELSGNCTLLSYFGTSCHFCSILHESWMKIGFSLFQKFYVKNCSWCIYHFSLFVFYKFFFKLVSVQIGDFAGVLDFIFHILTNQYITFVSVLNCRFCLILMVWKEIWGFYL